MLVERARSFLLFIDLQEKLLPAMRSGAGAVAATSRLIRAARLMDVPVRISEHCPESIGATAPELRAMARQGEIVTKTHFSLAAEPGALEALRALGRDQAILTGTEAHVCVLQTALGLKAAGFSPFVVMDGVSSRFEPDERAGLERMRAAGVGVVTSEMVLFEWMGRAKTEEFRAVMKIVKER